MRDELVKKYLNKEIRTFNPEIDDKDTPDFSAFLGYQGKEFSNANKKALLNELHKVKIKTDTIVEIGVARLIHKGHSMETGEVTSENSIPFTDSSTSIFLRNKKDTTKYLGIDIEDKTHLESYKPNVYTLKAQSEDYEIVVNKLNKVGIEQIDFLFIDGWHSTNQVIDELWYLQFMKPGGVIGFHDVNHHPGPKAVLEALNPDMFEIINYNTPDWGIGFAKIK
jgi:cephalosporin hydroxylase